MKRRLARAWWLIKTVAGLAGKFRPVRLSDEELTRLVIHDPRFVHADLILEDGTTVTLSDREINVQGSKFASDVADEEHEANLL
jgi:hypothetical protein